MSEYSPTARTRVKRLHQRGRYDRETVHAILDAGIVCHIGYVIDGAPYVTPTLYWREHEQVYWHGSSASRMLRHQASGAPVCLAVSHLDALVLARSAFHHSVNYRSVMIFGKAQTVDDETEKVERLKTFLNGLYPGRWGELRPISAKELAATRLLFLNLDEVSAKVREGMPIDDEADYTWRCWAGVAPIETGLGAPQPCPRLLDDIQEPPYLRRLPLFSG